ncbi:MAG: SURF1 family protein [Herbaspirillum sp.]
MFLVFLGFLALGTWQVNRLFWKLDLIERVNHRVHADPVAAPGPDAWFHISASADAYEYLHVRLSGTFLYAQTVKVRAVTRLGSGFWLLTPLRGPDGVVTLINRGYIAADAHDIRQAASDAPARFTGLLRISEPGGGFLRDNDPATDRWFSRDVQAIAAAHKLDKVAPYFVDADATAAADVSMTEEMRAAAGDPVGGLTVIVFHNNHLIYILTWYGLALMTACTGYWVMRDENRRRGHI